LAGNFNSGLDQAYDPLKSCLTSIRTINIIILGTNQSAASDDTDSENYKLGAFATKRDILPRKVSSGICNESREDEESALMELFTVEECSHIDNVEKLTPQSPAPSVGLENKLKHLEIDPKSKAPFGSNVARKISFDENPSEEVNHRFSQINLASLQFKSYFRPSQTSEEMNLSFWTSGHLFPRLARRAISGIWHNRV